MTNDTERAPRTRIHLRGIIAIALCKMTAAVLRLFKRGATSLPGKVALCIDPSILKKVAAPVQSIVITGTNGKTTTAHMVYQAFADAELPCVFNRSGANLIQGITTEFIAHTTLSGKARCEYAVIECDEGVLRQVCACLDPAVFVVTNIFRDQLDRYGEVMHTRDNIAAGIAVSPHAAVCLNADCSLSVSLADGLANSVFFYDVQTGLHSTSAHDISDAPRCLYCMTEYEYDYLTYAHLGGFRCPRCGFCHPPADLTVTAVLDEGDENFLEVLLRNTPYRVSAIVSTGYDIYNWVAAALALLVFGFEQEPVFAALAHFKRGFGRMERFEANGVPIRLVLVKNPVGCNQIIETLLHEDEADGDIVCVLNDNECDGTDVSWIYDADWEAFCEKNDRAICSGTRAEDMALRLKYAGMSVRNLFIIKNYDRLIDTLVERRRSCTIIANYSAVMELRARFASRFGLEGFWE